MSDPTSPLGKLQGPIGDPNKFERQAKALRRAGGALLLPHHLAKMKPEVRAEVDRLLDEAWGKASRPV